MADEHELSFLIDWEPATIFGQSRHDGSCHIGTMPFMALALLNEEYWEGKMKRQYHHDLEGFLWILPFDSPASKMSTPDSWVASIGSGSERAQVQARWAAAAREHEPALVLCKHGWLGLAAAARGYERKRGGQRQQEDMSAAREHEHRQGGRRQQEDTGPHLRAQVGSASAARGYECGQGGRQQREDTSAGKVGSGIERGHICTRLGERRWRSATAARGYECGKGWVAAARGYKLTLVLYERGCRASRALILCEREQGIGSGSERVWARSQTSAASPRLVSPPPPTTTTSAHARLVRRAHASSYTMSACLLLYDECMPPLVSPPLPPTISARVLLYKYATASSQFLFIILDSSEMKATPSHEMGWILFCGILPSIHESWSPQSGSTGVEVSEDAYAKVSSKETYLDFWKRMKTLANLPRTKELIPNLWRFVPATLLGAWQLL
ncbi:hypothetical protein HETIRDRAFT_117850 [Heterobasidion irregulare TC 32-1]|uniref:Fungal-type protein kinase domain-containing protein n=1 Tax=Heterobasidion irregulare (strain TC 32-1) TaxID=747525 RepID=W4K0V9_HETIT|nr:uncharacterized protein HETIRDRAFT_117850 [Heterobasidion irregulare TC 32-1]ETW79339.1 hypothetical protein HETIRDRAFT_117850 [Heterobasidion irregulare TC 32-1]